MENISLPSKIEVTPGKTKNEATISIQPCHPGYGTTLGNALRRVLLSSLPGAAVTAFKIKGIQHEFTNIDHIKEDAVEIALNLKQLRLKTHTPEPIRLEIKTKGEKKVTAKDIKTHSEAEIANPELVIATLTDKETELDMELIVNQGRGYMPSEIQEKESLEVGMIAIDAIFTPMKNVGFKIENVRVGQMTNYENLILNIETDGTITPQEAINQSTQILIDHFGFILDQTSGKEPKKVKKEKIKEEKEEKIEEPKKEEKVEKETPTTKESEAKEEKPKKRGRPKKEDKPEETKKVTTDEEKK